MATPTDECVLRMEWCGVVVPKDVRPVLFFPFLSFLAVRDAIHSCVWVGGFAGATAWKLPELQLRDGKRWMDMWAEKAAIILEGVRVWPVCVCAGRGEGGGGDACS